MICTCTTDGYSRFSSSKCSRCNALHVYTLAASCTIMEHTLQHQHVARGTISQSYLLLHVFCRVHPILSQKSAVTSAFHAFDYVDTCLRTIATYVYGFCSSCGGNCGMPLVLGTSDIPTRNHSWLLSNILTSEVPEPKNSKSNGMAAMASITNHPFM